MAFHYNGSFADSQSIVGISVGKSGRDALHSKLLINFAGYCGELHLAFHNKTVFSNVFEEADKYIWDAPRGIPLSRLKALAAKCVSIIKKIDQQNIPYAIEYKGMRKFNGEGIYDDYRTGSEFGLTCATFILAIFDSAGLNLLEWENWPVRSNDSVWFDELIRYIDTARARRWTVMSDEHYNNLKSEANCKKIRPEEVFSAVYSIASPQKFCCSEMIGPFVRSHVLGLA